MKHIEHIVKEHCQKKVKETMNNTTLLIMATGIGSCFGQGIKQLEPVLKTNDTWYGMTYNEDVAAVKDSFKKMLENGVYKADLFSDM